MDEWENNTRKCLVIGIPRAMKQSVILEFGKVSCSTSTTIFPQKGQLRKRTYSTIMNEGKFIRQNKKLQGGCRKGY